MPLTREQRDALWAADGIPLRDHRIVSARPGTGKTTTISEYCIDVANDWASHHASWQGMAVLSYTNVAKDEIERKIRELGRANALLSPPHFVGTIDSFVNQQLFLPFGARLMGCGSTRPRLVGEPYSRWTMSYALRNSAPTDASSPVFFDCYGLSVQGGPVVIDRQPRQVSRTIARSAEAPTATNSPRILKMKQFIWSKGYALQNDANYFAYAVLRDSDALTRAFVRRFPVLVVDEAQDMTEVQHALLDHLKDSGQEHVVLMGDEYQAIYEWNTARPQLFVAKTTNSTWRANTISTTFRCSPAICTVLSKAAADGTDLVPASEGRNQHYDRPVEVRTYEPETEGAVVRETINDMAQLLSDKPAHDDNDQDTRTIAILTRSKDDAPRLQACFTGDDIPRATTPLSFDDPLTRHYLRVVFHLTRSDIYNAVGAYETLLLNIGPYEDKAEMRVALARQFGNGGSTEPISYRVAILDDLRTIGAGLAARGDVAVSACSSSCDSVLKCLPAGALRGVREDCTDATGEDDRAVSSLFTAHNERTYVSHPAFGNVRLTFSTVHGVKGETFDGVIFHTKEMTSPCGCNPSRKKWSLILEHDIVTCENKRIAYVALSRAAQTLFVLAPSASATAWQSLT